ncbi:hypothetical protein PFNF135_05504 [Plasmodium falciparum NF135/5.C10]|uniref:Uncharacterized protein n=1 Tax=Plasmodium falciparum NF135/5.C10 TaxID=1036726 RepID=W4IAI3_PLAFA|nr:hypothetical protein PFNF135_05504 [Plasmodium falciparum NF135/5.C10]
MSLLSDSDLKEIHKKIIDSTIKNCGQFYNARILEAIKMRWIKIYEQKLRNKELGLVSNDIINRQMFQLLRNSNNNNFICDTVTYSFLTNVVDNTNYEEIFS